jgi:hypothetical protein
MTDPYGGLVRPGETPDAALRRLERQPDIYFDVVGTDEGQRLLEAAARQAEAARRGSPVLVEEEA